MKNTAIIAIDGPAASGKSSVSRLVADRLGFVHIDSGAMYRAVTWKIQKAGIDPKDAHAVAELLPSLGFDCFIAAGATQIYIDGEDPGQALKSNEVNSGVSHIAAIPEVRQFLVSEQRRFGDIADIVMEGRDIGSVVFPDSPYRFYIDASQEVRDLRRQKEGGGDSIRERDHIDSTRANSPLVVAPGALILDTSDLTLEQVVERVIAELAEMGLAAAQGVALDSSES